MKWKSHVLWVKNYFKKIAKINIYNGLSYITGLSLFESRKLPWVTKNCPESSWGFLILKKKLQINKIKFFKKLVTKLQNICQLNFIQNLEKTDLRFQKS